MTTGRALGYAAGIVTVVIAGVVVLVSMSADPVATPRSAGPPVARVGQRLGVPAYIDPASDPGAWLTLTGPGAGTVGIVVANVDSGPGSEAEPAWASAIRQAHDAGSKVLGYVDTGYLGGTTAGRPDGLPTRSGATGIQAWLAQVRADIAVWYQFYGNDLDGIFMDQGTSACGPVALSTEYADRYRVLSQEVRLAHPGSLTALNPGTAVGECFRNSADVLVTFEGSYGDYTGAGARAGEAYQPLSWSPSAPDRIWHIVYGAGSAHQLRTALALSKDRGAGYVYVTPAVPPNPFDSIPPSDYWAEERSGTSE